MSKSQLSVAQTFRLKFEWVDVILFFYLLVFVRQYFWILNHNKVAWLLSVLISIPLWYLYVSTKPYRLEKSGPAFWLIVGIPLLIAYCYRVAFPDLSFDVLTYHLLHAERSLRGTLFAPDDYFPTQIAFNPVADTLTGLTRHLLGFRLGTVANLIVLLWIGKLLIQILNSFIRHAWVRAFFVLLILFNENVLFEISTYLVDLMALPLLLQALLIALKLDEYEDRASGLVHCAALLGAAMAFKFTNFAAVLPILLILAYWIFFGPNRLTPKRLVPALGMMSAVFLAPLIPFTVYIYKLTGNPVFPVANRFFNSPFWPTHGGWDNRWGPHTLVETIVWPVMIWFKPERYSELAVYSGRMSLAFIMSILGLVLGWRHTRLRTSCLVLLASSYLWTVMALGYSRYGLFQELWAGVVVLAVASVVIQCQSHTYSWRKLVPAAMLALVLAQSVIGVSYSLYTEWGDRPNPIAQPDLYLTEIQQILRDRSLLDYLNPTDRGRFENVAVWFETAPKSTGMEVLLNPGAPVIALRQPEFFFTTEALREFIKKVNATTGRNMYSLCHDGYFNEAKQAIAARNLEIGKVERIELPFFSRQKWIGMMLIEIRIPNDSAARERFETAWMKGAFSIDGYREQIVALNPPSQMRVGEKLDLRFKVKNVGNVTWIATGTKDFQYQINMGNHWILNGVASEDSRAVMGHDLSPGAEIEIMMTVKAPPVPGNYTLEIDMVHEGVTWFKERGATPLSMPVHVYQ
jgi:hypothetical protein